MNFKRYISSFALLVIIMGISLILSSCVVNTQSAPYKPSTPYPANGKTLLATSVTLSWNCSDPKNRSLSYSVYFEKGSSATTLVASDISRNFYKEDVFYNTSYSWRIVAKNDLGKIATGNAWHFKIVDALPVIPYDPSPKNGLASAATSTQLSWKCYDPDGDIITYSLYFGTSTIPPFVGKTPYKYYTPQKLEASTKYYWKVVAKDTHDGVATSAVWSFTTSSKANHPPLKPSNPNPSNGKFGIQPKNITLSWTDSDPDDDSLTYDVYFGKNLTFVGTTTSKSYDVGAVKYATKYQWRIVAKDPYGGTATGDVWTFTTFDRAPNAPKESYPTDNSTGVSASGLNFRWSCSDPDGNPLTYDLYLGASSNPPLFKSGINSTSYRTDVDYNEEYHWKIVAKDNFGKTSTSAVWAFTTSNPPNRPPKTPSNPSPFNGKIGVLLNPTLSWADSDPDGDPITYDVYFGTSSNPPLVKSGINSKSYRVSNLANSKIYHWKIVAKDDHGHVTVGPVWNFTTISQPPSVPNSPYPSNGQSSVSPDTQLSWYDSTGLTYDVYVGQSSNSMSKVESDATSRLYTPVLDYLQGGKTYYWKVIAKNSDGGSSPSPIWSFTTTTNDPDGRMILEDQIVGAKSPFILNVKGMGISNFKGMEMKLGFDPSKITIDTSKGNNGVSLTGPLSGATLMPSGVDNSNGSIDIDLALLSNTVNIKDDVCLKVYFINKMTSGMTKVSTTYLVVRNGSNNSIKVSHSDVGVIRIQ